MPRVQTAEPDGWPADLGPITAGPLSWIMPKWRPGPFLPITPARINSLPKWARNYIHHVDTFVGRVPAPSRAHRPQTAQHPSLPDAVWINPPTSTKENTPQTIP